MRGFADLCSDFLTTTGRRQFLLSLTEFGAGFAGRNSVGSKNAKKAPHRNFLTSTDSLWNIVLSINFHLSACFRDRKDRSPVTLRQPHRC